MTLGRGLGALLAVLSVACSEQNVTAQQDDLPKSADSSSGGSGDSSTPAVDSGGSEPSVAASLPPQEPTPHPLMAYLGAVGTWCGPDDASNVWLSATADDSTCEVQASVIYSGDEGVRADGMAFAIPPDAQAELGSFEAPLRHCSSGTCVTLSASITLTSYSPDVGASGSWSALTSQGTLQGEFTAGSCVWNDLLPLHPAGGRLARDLSIAELAIYQAVKVPLMVNGELSQERNAPVVQGRDALVRVFVEPLPGWVPRQVSAQLTLFNDGDESVFESTKAVVQASSDAELDSSFNFEVPGDVLGPNTEYEVQVRELSSCTPLLGKVKGARFPETGSTGLHAMATGPIAITLVPVRYDTDGSRRLPDTSEQQLENFRSAVMAVFPTTEVKLTVRRAIGTIEDDLEAILNQVSAVRAADEPDINVHYYGLVSPATSFASYCSGTCITGIGQTSVSGPNWMRGLSAIGLGFLSRESTITLVHELGHTHGQSHAPCGGPGGVDPAYPYPTGNIGVWGLDLDTLQLIDPATHNDFLGYCPNQWVSDYNFGAFATRIATLTERTESRHFLIGAPPPKLPWNTLMLDAQGNGRWGLPIEYRGTPDGMPETAVILDERLLPVREVEVYRIPLSEGGASHLAVPTPEPGWTAIRAQGARAVLFAQELSVSPIAP